MEQNQPNVNVTLPIQSFVPLMTQKQFSELSGLTRDSVKAQVINGYWPSVKVGKYRMINIVSLVDQLKVANSELLGG